MLERTAASIETCSLQRVLSKPAHSAKHRRQLYQGFWQHGASAIELGSAWPPSPRAAEPPTEYIGTASQQTSLVASAFVLDFLYPNLTLASLRRAYPRLPRPQDGSRPSAASRRRHFASSTSAAEEEKEQGEGKPPSDSESAQTSSVENMMRQSRLHDAKSRGKRDDDGALAEDLFQIKAEKKQNSRESIEAIVREAQLDVRKIIENRPRPKPSDLPELLSRPEDECYHDIWDLYCRVGKDDQQKLRRQVVLYLSKSHSVVEIGRCMSLLPQVTVDQWDNEFLAAAVMTHMRSGDLVYAIGQFKAGLKNGLSGGLEYILSDTIINRQWSKVVETWMAYYGAVAENDLDQLERLETLPDLGSLYVSFETWIAKTDRDSRSGLSGALSSPGLRIFRRRFAELALEQGCSPRQADVIIQSLGDHRLCHDYILRMIERWNEKLETKGNLTILHDIYRNYRQMSGFKPCIEVLRGMFNLYFPHNAAGLEELFSDWHCTWGDLDQWGYEKFLKYYSRRGDVDAVQTLWKRYVERFPEVLRGNMAFRSTMNVYAQTGDVAQAEKEMQKMTQEYEIRPDIDTWNTMLKCCVRADDYDLVLKCFKEIRELHRPDSFTYAHVMAMTSKRGDLEKTLEFFSQSQQEGIPTSQQMVLALVTVYCRNDQLRAAETICIELAERKVTSTDAWNELIRCNGMQGKLDKCYELLQIMKKYGAEWDHDTYEELFQAMVKVDQIQDAYNLLRRADKERLFKVSPDHFAVIIAGAMKTGETDILPAIRERMQQGGQRMTFAAHVALAEASYKRAPKSVATGRLVKQMVGSLRSVLSYGDGADGEGRRAKLEGSVSGISRDMRHLNKQTASVGRAIRLLVDFGDVNLAEDLINLYLDIFPGYKQSEAFPQSILAALMTAYLATGQYDKIHQMWDKNWARVRTAYRQPKGGIYPAKQYALARTMDAMARVFRRQQDGEGLLRCVETVTQAGFKLSSANWNIIVTYLAEMGQWEPAMRWCETLLMPQWSGWSADQLRIDDRRDRKNTRLLWPTSDTILALLRKWLEKRKLRAWSAEASKYLDDVETHFPRLHQAFVTSDLRNVGSLWVLEGYMNKKSVARAIDSMMKPLTIQELTSMRTALRRQLQRVKTKDPHHRDKNPFHGATGENAGKVLTEPLPTPVLMQMHTVLQAKLKVDAAKDELAKGGEGSKLDAWTDIWATLPGGDAVEDGTEPKANPVGETEPDRQPRGGNKEK